MAFWIEMGVFVIDVMWCGVPRLDYDQEVVGAVLRACPEDVKMTCGISPTPGVLEAA